jgi:phospholipid/cholesterol/gamma-HCH transport system substrate-binding protein
MDLMVGASILIALCILIGGVLWLKEALVTEKQVYYTFLFPNVGSLQVGDPVMVNGVTKGRVAALYLRRELVAAVVHLDNEVALTDSCRPVVQNIGLMGERGIGLQLSAAGGNLRPTRKNDTMFVAGYFDSGIAEAMGMMGSVLLKMESLATDVSSLMNNTVGDTSFIRLFHSLSCRLDTLTGLTERIIARNGPLVDKSVTDLAEASSQLKGLVDKNSDHLSTIMANGAAISTGALAVIARADSLSTMIKGMAGDVEDGKGPLGMMLKDEQFAQDLRHAVRGIDSLTAQVRTDGLRLRLKLGYGKTKN